MQHVQTLVYNINSMELQLVQLTILVAGKVVARNAKTMMAVIIGLGGEILVNANFYRDEIL